MVAADVGSTDDPQALAFWQSSDVLGFSDYQRLFMFLEHADAAEKEAEVFLSTCARAVSSRIIRVARMTNYIKLHQSCQKDLVNPFHTYGLIDPYYRIDASRRPWIRPRSWQPGGP